MQLPLYVVFLWGDIILITTDCLCTMVKNANDAEFVDERMVGTKLQIMIRMGRFMVYGVELAFVADLDKAI